LSFISDFSFVLPSPASPAVLKVEYAVRGAVPQKATEYSLQLAKGKDLPFKKIVTANIGNPQQAGLDQKPITWWRQVSAFLFTPSCP
jgi:alanine transaminase